MNEQQLAPANIPDVTMTLNPVQQGWVRLADFRMQTSEFLTKSELQIQGILANIEQLTDHAAVKMKVEEAAQVAKNAKDQRLGFTGMIDERIIKPLMVYEKRNDELIGSAKKHELSLRLIEEDKAKKKQQKASELANLRAHITNEYFRIATDYRAKVKWEILKAYTNCLETKMDPAGVPDIKAMLGKVIREDITLPLFNKFPLSLVTPEEAAVEFQAIKAYDPANDLAQFYRDIEEKFAMYYEDLQNAAAAIASAQQTTAAEINDSHEKLQAEVATNTLVARAETAVVSGPTVKRTMEIVEEDGEAWAIKVVSTFLKNWQYCNKYVRVKKWSSMTVAQMGVALAKHMSETGEVFDGLTFKEVAR